MDTHIVGSTRAYETWLAAQTRVVSADLRLKHRRMAESPFGFLRATFYRWLQRWSALPASLVGAPALIAVGDLHVENFGTWRDAEGRLIWGVNDVDEACVLPYTQDLVRLATGACLAVHQGHFALSNRVVFDAILEGYAACLERGHRPVVLEERHAGPRRTTRCARCCRPAWTSTACTIVSQEWAVWGRSGSSRSRTGPAGSSRAKPKRGFLRRPGGRRHRRSWQIACY